MTPQQQAQEQLADLSVLYEVGRSFTATLNLSHLLDIIPHEVARALQAQTAVLRLLDEESGDFGIASRFDGDGGHPCAAVEERLAAITCQAAVPVLIPDLRQDSRFACPEGADVASALGIPLLWQQALIGTLSLIGKWAAAPGEAAAFPTTFGERDLRLLEALGGQAVVAIQNARLLEQARAASAQLAALNDLSQRLSGSLDLQKVFDYVVQAAVDLLGLGAARLWIWEEGTGLLHLRASAGAPDLLAYPREVFAPDEGLVGSAFQSLASLTLPDAAGDSRYKDQDWAQQMGIRSTAAIPLLREGRAVGVLSVTRQTRRPFAREELKLLASFAQHAAVAIGNARLFEQEHTRRRQLEVMRTISEEITRELEVGILLDLIIRRAAELAEASLGIIWLWDEAAQLLVPQTWIGYDPWIGGLRFRLGEGVAGAAAAQRAGVIVNDFRTSHYAPSVVLERTAITAVLAEPLLYRERLLGVIVVAKEEAGRPFLERDRETLGLLAAQAAVALENARLHEATRRRAEQLATLNRLAGTLTRTLQPAELAQSILGAVQVLIPQAVGRLWGFRQEDETLVLIGGIGLRDPEGGAKKAFRIGEGLVGMAAATRQPVSSPDVTRDPNFLDPAWAAAEGVVSNIVMPLVYGEQLFGALAVFTRQPREFSAEEVDLLRTFAAQAAIALENARLYAASARRAAELEALREIDQAIGARLELPAVLEAVAGGAMQLLGSQHTQIVLWDEAAQRLHYGAAVGTHADRVKHQQFDLGRGINGVVAQTRQPVVLDDYRASLHALPEFADVTATITVPVLFGARLLGVLHSHTTEPHKRFTADDLRRLQLLAGRAGISIQNARLYEERDRLAQAHLLRLRQISILNEIGAAMQGTMRLDALLRAILTGATFGGGLGFNRAILFLVDETGQVLRGRMGVGPSSSEEAARIWQQLASDSRSLAEIIAERAAQQSEGAESDFDRLARSLEIPLRPDGGILARTVLEARPFHVTNARQDPEVRPHGSGRLEVDEFASVPLVAKGKVVGGICVDNKFSGRPITDEDFELLSVFANQAGLAVESAQVYTRLEAAHQEIQRSHHQLVQHERLAALGEMAAHVVHEIRNPLVAIGGFARRLAQHLAGREAEGQYAQIIAREVERLEQILRDVRAISRESQLAPAATDLDGLVRESLVLFADRIKLQGVRLQRVLAERPPIVSVDAVQVKQAILNLLANALEAMPQGGTLTVVIGVVRGRPAGQPADRPEAATGGGLPDGVADRGAEGSAEGPVPDEWVTLRVGDTGGGIREEILEKIFNPFFTTKEMGTGLGLSLVHRIARMHGGWVEVDNRPGEGVTFGLWLPRGGAADAQAAAAA